MGWPEVLVRQDGRVARLGRQDLDAAATETLARDLIAARAVMWPKRAPVLFPGAPILLGDEGVVHVQAEAGTRVLVAVHLRGLGWVGARVGRARLLSLIGTATERRRQRSRAEGQPR